MITPHLLPHIDYIRRIARSMISNHANIDDAVQECCELILEKEHMWNGDVDKVNQWMNAVSRNYINYNYIRHKAKKICPIKYLAVRRQEEEMEDKEERVQAVLKKLNTLPRRQREAVTKKYLEGMKTIDVAKAMGVSQPCASIQIRKGLEKLR